MKTLFFLIVVCAFIVSGVTALTISPVRYNESVTAGSTVDFSVSLTADTAKEKVIQNVTIEGVCGEWVTISPEAPTPLPAQFKLSASIPKDAENGRTRCDVAFVQPSQGMISAAVGYPITFDVKGGAVPTVTIEQHVITSTTPASSKAPTPAPTLAAEQRTLTAPDQEPAPITTSTPTAADPIVPFWISIVVVYLVATFGIVILWSEYKERKKK